jgi:hypothetical protein
MAYSFGSFGSMAATEAETAVRLRPRRRTWDQNRELHEEVDLTAEALTALFGMRMADAARSLGVSPTTLKIVCRRLGIERWPYSRTGRVRVRTGVVTWERSREGLAEVQLTVEALTPLFGMRVSDAARSLDIGVSTLKTVCRRLGIERWPYSRGVKGAGEADEADELWCIADDVGVAGDGGGLGGAGAGAGAGEAGEGGALWFSAEGRADSAEGGEEETDLWFLAETRGAEEGAELDFLACN